MSTAIRFRFSPLLGIGFAFLCSTPGARAIDPNRTISQYVHERWGAESGFPRGPVYAINQTPDGYLWIGTEKGLIQFDGISFRLLQSGKPELPVVSHVLGLLTDRDGSLWTRLRRPTLLRYRGGVFEDSMTGFGRPRSSVTAIAHGRNGELLLWVLDGEPSAVVLHGGKFETIAAPVGFSRSPVLALTQTSDGDVWVGTRDAGLFRLRGKQTIAITEGLPDPKVNALVVTKNDELWVGTDGGIARWDGAKLTRSGVPHSLDGVEVLAMILDRDGNLWAGTNSRGLMRANAQGVAVHEERASGSTEAVTALFEDREGNVWAGSSNGLERFRDSAFMTYSLAEGLPSDGSNPVFVDAGERVWFPPVDGGLWWFKDAQRGRITKDGLDRDVIYSITGGDGELWVGRQRGGLTRLRAGRGSITAKTYTQADGLAQNSVYSVYRSGDGAIWAGTLSGGVSKFSDGRFTNYTIANGLAANTVASVLESSDGTMWFATPAGLSAFSKGRWRSYSSKDGLPSQDVNCLLEDSTGVLWVGTAAGLAFRGPNHFQEVSGALEPLREQVLGLAEDKFGALWVATASHVLRVNREKLRRGVLGEGDAREFGLADGLRGTEGVKRHRSVVTDPAGRVWFSLNRGISVVDPARLRSSSVPSIVHVQNILVDGSPIGLSGPVRVPGGFQRIAFEFAGLSLSIPDRVRFRYKLDGFDPGWSEPAGTREAVYTNLSPRSYRFRVIASNPDGVWSSQEDSIGFEIDPLFWQTWWFRATVIAMSLVGGLALYRFRLHQVTKRMNLRFEERLAERTRIAQELHDTLLQGFLSVSMQAHIASDLLPEDSAAKPTFTRALQLMGQVIEEGRNTVRGLRSSSNAALDLEDAFAQIQQELTPDVDAGELTEFRIIVDGKRRPLNPLLRDEVYRIGREALINAFRHARAKSIDLELKYSPNDFRVLVRDDGCGIDPQILESEGDRHWGLSRMRERADRIGAHFHVWSSPTAGTEVELLVPGDVAFQDYRIDRLTWMRKYFRRRSRHEKPQVRNGAIK